MFLNYTETTKINTLSYTTLFRSEKWWHHEKAEERYDYRYAQDELEEWIPKIRKLADHALRVYVFFNNHVRDRKSTRLNSSHQIISYAVFCLKKKNIKKKTYILRR